MGTTIHIMVKYKCCLVENNEEIEDEEEDNNKQLVTQLPAIEMENSEESFATTIPCKLRK
jgi:hypothetical protein